MENKESSSSHSQVNPPFHSTYHQPSNQPIHLVPIEKLGAIPHNSGPEKDRIKALTDFRTLTISNVHSLEELIGRNERFNYVISQARKVDDTGILYKSFLDALGLLNTSKCSMDCLSKITESMIEMERNKDKNEKSETPSKKLAQGKRKAS